MSIPWPLIALVAAGYFGVVPLAAWCLARAADRGDHQMGRAIADHRRRSRP